MPPPIAIVWLPTAVGLGTPTIVLLVIWLRNEIAKRRGPDEGDGSDDGGGGGGRRPPPSPPPVGPVSWPEFEREFADYVRARSSAPTGADTGVVGTAERPPMAASSSRSAVTSVRRTERSSSTA
jgi:hypothetical protein